MKRELLFAAALLAPCSNFAEVAVDRERSEVVHRIEVCFSRILSGKEHVLIGKHAVRKDPTSIQLEKPELNKLLETFSSGSVAE